MRSQTPLNRRCFIQLLSTLGAGVFAGSGCTARFYPKESETGAATDGGVHLPLRLHSNESPYGPFPQALDAICRVATMSHRYTGDERLVLRKTVADHYGLDPGQVVLGCGSIELLKIITEVFCGPGLPPIIAEPVYEAIGYYSSLQRIRPIQVPLTKDYKHDLDRLARECQKGESMVYLCNPANPTGTIVPKDAVRRFLNRVPDHVIVVVDEAYAEYVDRPDYESCVRYVKEGRQNVVVLRTFSKLYGLAGLRVGYALGSEKPIGAMSSHRLWNNINQAGAAAALASFDDREKVGAVRQQNALVRQYFYKKSGELGLDVIPSEASFVMLNVNQPSTEMIAACKARRILIGRPVSSLPEHVRISLGTREEMALFFQVLKGILRG